MDNIRWHVHLRLVWHSLADTGNYLSITRVVPVPAKGSESGKRGSAAVRARI
jgi:hypothetical protein